MQIEFYQTFRFQIEVLPRVTVLYFDVFVIAFEWLWFGVSFTFLSKSN